MLTRIGWHEYFLNICAAVALRADCRRSQVGAVLVNEDHIIIGTGYNGTRSGSPGCLSGACPRGLLSYSEVEANSDYSDPSSPGYCISNHAEINCLLHVTGTVQGATMYSTRKPCPACEKTLCNAGLKAVYWPEGSIQWDMN